jgi:serine/threonine protein kinase
MGEVSRAHDSTLGREVALKLLPEPWLADTDRRMRFEREARLLAALNHPNIAAIYGVHEGATVPGADSTIRVLVLELVEGETLADRVAVQQGRGGLPLADAIDIATQIVDALEAAHTRGIVHRDLKPANIKVTPEGRVKVLDFGLARALPGDEARADLLSSPTVTAHTHAGVLLGTAPYMSPEQARGRAADRRADIWAFGCVLYEMLAGAPAFKGQDIADVLANVLKSEPDWSAVPAGTPSHVHLCLQRCLQKDLRQRFQDIGDVRLALAGAFDAPPRERVPATTPRGAWAGWVIAAVALIALGVLLISPRQGPDAPETRLEIVTPPAIDPLSIDISPDGRSVVFAAIDTGGQSLSLRRLESNRAEPISGTNGASMPFWSPDSRSLAFFANGELKRIDLADGFVRTLAPASNARGGTWNRDGTIVFGAVGMGPLSRVSAVGGAVTQVTDLLPGQTSHRWPQFLPDGRHFLLMTLGIPDVRGLYLASLDDRTVRRVSDRESAFSFVPPDHLLVVRDGGLLAQRLSADYLRLEGEAVAVAPKILIDGGMTGYASLRASASGHIIFRSSAAQTQLVWLDRAGKLVGTIGDADDTQTLIARLSPDGRTLSVQRMVNGNSDVWLIDTDRGVPRRMTLSPAFDGNAVFSADGGRIVYTTDADRDVFDTLYTRLTDGTGTPEKFFEFGVRENHYTRDWSMDSRFLLYDNENRETQSDVWALPVTRGKQPIEIARTAFNEWGGQFSPDGRWVAYTSDETGSVQVFLKPFPGPGPNRQLSSGGGLYPRWRRDGKELFYVEADRLMSLPVTQSGKTLEFGPVRTLFRFPLGSWGFEPSLDGQRLVLTKAMTDASPITVILNWKPPAR